MGNLSNLYISQSFISLIHLGSDNTASGVSTQLEDGLGNGIGIYVNTSGSVSASSYSGSVNGIGNVSAFSTSVDSRLDNLELFSSSLDATFATDAQLNASSSTLQANINTKLDTASFNTFSSSQFEIEVSQSQQISASFASSSAYSASLQSSILALSSSLSSSTGNTTALSASIYQTDTTQSFQIGANAATASGFSASLSTTITNNSASTFQTDATQSFQITANALTASNSLTSLSQSLYFTDTTQSANINSLTALTSSTVRNNQNNTYTAGTTQSFDSITANSASITYLKVIFQTSSVVYSSGSNILGDNANDDTQTLIGRNILTGSAEVTGSLKVTSDISSSTLNGIGNVTLYSASVAASITSSTANVTTLSASIYQTDSTQSYQITANALTASNATTALSQSLYFTDITQSANINSLTAQTSSYATTGSNSFSGSQIITGSLIVNYDTLSNPQLVIDKNTYEVSLRKIQGLQPMLIENQSTTNLEIISTVTKGVVINNNEFYYDASGLLNQLQKTQINGKLVVTGEITASGNISSSGNIYAANLTASVINTGSFVTTSSFNSYTASQDFKNTTFATTGSNVFIGNQTITGSLLISGSEVLRGTLSASALRVENNTYLDGTLTVTNDTLINGDVTIQSATPNLKLRDTSGGGFSSGYDLRVDTGSFEIYDDTHNRDVLSDFFNSASQQHTTSLTSEIIVISGSTSVTLLGNVSASIISASTINGFGSPTLYSASVDSRLDNLELGSSSVSTSVGLLQTFSGSEYKADSSSFNSRINAAGGTTVLLDEGTILGNAAAFNFIGSGVTATLSAGTASVTIPGGSAPAGTVSSSQQIIELGFLQTSSFNAYTQSTNDFTASITASFNSLSSSYVATSQSFNDLSSSFLLVSSSTLTFATTGSNNFVGNQTITGSLTLSSSAAVELNIIGNTIITGSLILSSSAVTELQVIGAVELTGSVAGNITALSVTSNTASIDFNSGSFFTLTIPSSAITYITGSNLKPGQTANIILTQQVTTGSVRFETTLFKFPSGSINTGSAIASAVDMVSVASVNSTTLFSVTANRLI